MQLLCEPIFFNVNYVINPWMASHVNQVDRARALQQWQDFYQVLRRETSVKLMTPQPYLPDLVFTANAALVQHKRCLLSHFRYLERQGEEPFFKEWFTKAGYQISELPREICFEGEGDALFQPGEKWLWMGYGFRTDIAASDLIRDFFQVPVVTLKLVDPKFYHLDTCLCPLQNGTVMYYPPAFDPASQQAIQKLVPKEKRIIVSDADANNFACNAVVIPKQNQKNVIIMNFASLTLQQRLMQLGYQLIIQPVDEFMKAGGANKCLVLTL